jgi:Caspase domain
LYYFKDRHKINLDVVYEKFYTPNLYQRLINGEIFDPINISINQAPTATIIYAEKTRNLNVEEDNPIYQNTTGLAEITVNATTPDDAIDEIRLFHNGKIVTLTTRNLIVTDDAKNNSATKKFTINLLNGNNTFRAVALNSQRTESDPDEIIVVYKTDNTATSNVVMNTATGTVDVVDKNATMYLVVVGINQYQNKTMSLNYAMADATAFKDEIEKDAKSMLTTVKTYFVSDNDATKGGIEKALKEVQKSAKPLDVFIFYYAGHGVINTANKEFYLVPTDVSDLKNVNTELEQKGLAAKLLQQYAIEIQAQKQLFILDACQSAGAFSSMLTASGDQQKNIAVVARATGTHWIAASGAQQFANEFASLGHGVFTYVLLDALKGQAAANKMITVNNLKNYLQKTVPELMKKYNGSPQFPASYGFGNDFPVEVIK